MNFNLGHTHYIVGLIAGGVAPNVVPPHAEAELMFRTVASARDIMRVCSNRLRRGWLSNRFSVPPVRPKTVPGFDTAVFPYTTDIPFLHGWGEPRCLARAPSTLHTIR